MMNIDDQCVSWESVFILDLKLLFVRKQVLRGGDLSLICELEIYRACTNDAGLCITVRFSK